MSPRRENAAPQIDPFVSLFIAIAPPNAGMFVRLRADIAIVREEAVGNGKHLARIEGTVPGALGRPCPERTVRATGPEYDLRRPNTDSFRTPACAVI